MGRSPCCVKEGLNRGAWTAIEDKLLTEYIKAHGEGKWRNIPKEAGLKRCGKSCRLRWLNYLRPDIKRGNLTEDEEDLIVRLHRLLGNRWSLIAGRLPGRTDNEIKNYWNTKLSKKAQAKQSNHSKSEKKSEIRTLTESPCPGVIRSKAVRCTRSLVTLQQHKTENHGTPYMVEAPSKDTTIVHPLPVESKWNCGSFSFLSNEENSSNYMIDRHVGEIDLSEIFSSDFDDIFTMDNVIGARTVEKMGDNWSNGSDCFQAKMESDSGYLAYFLDSSEEHWMV